MKTALVFSLFLTSLIAAQIQDISNHTIQTQYRRGVELQNGYQTYEQKYSGKDLNEEKRRLFPLQSTGVWTELNPKVPRVDYIGVHFVNKDTGWACGDLGAIIKTTDGGTSWTVSETNTTSLLLKIFSLDAQLVICTGYDGLILRSTDGGETFVKVTSGVGTGIDLWGVQMLNNALGWVCGNYHTLLKTTDAGLSWSPVNAGLNQHYWSLDFLYENFGMIACGNGFVLKTSDGGNNWTQIQTSDTRSLYSIDVIDSLHIAAAGGWGNGIQYEGGKNIYSSDAGLTWILNPDIPTYTDANWIEFIDADTGYAMLVDKGIYKTTNRGQSWFSVGGGGEWQLDLTEDRTGYSGGDGLNIYKRTNGIENWCKIFLNVNWSDVFFLNENKGFFISADLGEGIYKTEDSGISYQKVENSPIGYNLFFLDSLIGFVAGKYKTTDSGENWYQVNTGGGTKVFFINDSVGWSIDSHIYKTTDQGENWFIQVTAPGADNFSSIFFVDTLNGWATSRYIWQTTNGGDNWIERSDIPIFFPNNIYFINQFNGWIISGNELYYTTDSGTSWILDPQVYTYSLNFEAISDSHYVITGSNIYESINAGQVWQNITGDVGSGFASLQAPKKYLAYGVSTLGYIVRYLDTSIVPVELINFSAEYSDNKINLYWMTATETNNKGFEVQRSDAGNNKSIWQKIGFLKGNGTTTEKHSYSFNDESVASGIYKYRLKQIDFDGKFKYSKEIEVDVTAPMVFSLEQNYPNPFNPVTTIRYSIPNVISIPTGRERNLVTLKIYNVLGEEVANLVNEQKLAGRYGIKFDGSNLPSGVYIYRLTAVPIGRQAGSYSAVKKMILLK